MKEQRIKRLSIGISFIYGGVKYISIATVFKDCCTPEYNAISDDGSKVLIPYNAKVILIEENNEKHE